MRFRSITVLALASTLLGPLSVATAEEPAGPATKAESAATTGPAAKTDTRCEPNTQSRIRPSRASGCKGALPTRTYTREELQSTGQIDLAEALRRLDPRFL